MNTMAFVAVMAALSMARHDAPVTFSTLIPTPLPVEGLTADEEGNQDRLYGSAGGCAGVAAPR